MMLPELRIVGVGVRCQGCALAMGSLTHFTSPSYIHVFFFLKNYALADG